MEPAHREALATIYHGDCVEVLEHIEAATVDAVVTDPPYGLAFMGQDWDRFDPAAFQAWSQRWAAAVLRVMKPGAHLLTFGGTRTYHRLTCALEDAGLEIRGIERDAESVADAVRRLRQGVLL